MSQFLELPTELRIIIFSHLVIVDRPFLIGRFEDERPHQIRASPCMRHNHGPLEVLKAKWEKTRNLPIQPPITRVCRTFREEALPLWYSENHFYLIHNVFGPDITVPNSPRGFHPWVSQTPRNMFNFMQLVSLCGYTCWSNRVMITLDLKNRQVVSIKHFSYDSISHGLHIDQQSFIDSTTRALASKEDEDNFEALQAVLAERDDIFDIKRRYLPLERGGSCRFDRPPDGSMISRFRID